MATANFEEVNFQSLYDDLTQARVNISRPYTVVNMVSSLDGRVAHGGVAGKLGSAVDHRVMRKIRSACDALMEGAGTLRAENIDPRVPPDMAAARRGRGQTAQPLRVVIASSGDVPLDNLFFRAPGPPAVLFVSARTGEAKRKKLAEKARVIVAGRELVDLSEGAAILSRDFGVRSMVVEGGPVLTYAMLTEGLVDELFLTLAPKIVGGECAKAIVQGPELPSPYPLILRSVCRHENELFLRYCLVH